MTQSASTKPYSDQGEGDNRTLAQFFFELGYGACWADAFMAMPTLPQSFPLTDAAVDRAWDVLPMCQDTPEDYAEFDRRKALADAAQELLHALQCVVSSHESGSYESDGMAIDHARAIIAKATGETGA